MVDVIALGTTFIDYFFNANPSLFKKLKIDAEGDYLLDELKISKKSLFNKQTLIAKSPGGVSLNTSAILSSLNLKSAYYGVIGDDEDGDFWTTRLKRIDKSKIIRKGESSVCACLLSNRGKQRAFISFINPYDEYVLKHPDLQFLNSAKIIHLGPFSKSSPSSLTKIGKLLGKIKGPKISFTPTLLYAKHGIKKIIPILKNVDILFVNKNELKGLTEKDQKSGSKYLLRFGPQIIVCTMGARGALITTKNSQFTQKAQKVKHITDTTGAGDAYAAGFLYGILKNKSLKWSAKFANKIAARSLSNFGLTWLTL